MSTARSTLWHNPRIRLMAADAVIVPVVYYLALNFRYTASLDALRAWTSGFAIFVVFAVVVHLAVNYFAGVYAIVHRYIGLRQALRVGESALLAASFLFLVTATWPLYAGDNYLVPRSVVVGGGILTAIAMIIARFSYRLLKETHSRRSHPRERLLIVGGGQAADMIIREIQRTPSLCTEVVGLVDDNPRLKNMTIQGCPILGQVEAIPELAAKLQATQILVAIPSADAHEIARIHRICKPTGLPIKILPSVAELVSGTVTLRDARDLDLTDLLCRPKVEIEVGAISECIHDRPVLVTGAGGSIGSELCLQIARFEPSLLVLVDHDESALYELHERLQNIAFTRYALCPTNILQERKLEKLFQRYWPRLVFHAAAYKHVPLMELHPDEAVLNNIKGTGLVAEIAGRFKTERVINISTDKAVEPQNVLGATKRAGELIVERLAARYPDTLFASVRFGNVLGSQGSVVPIFRSQIESGGPVVITHPGVTRYFMLIEEAVQLVLQAALLIEEATPEEGGNSSLFVLEMGEPVPIIELAHKMIEFYWKDGSRSLGVEFSGLRPGEKLDERLIWNYEEILSTRHPMIKRVRVKREVQSEELAPKDFEKRLQHLISLAQEHPPAEVILRALEKCIPGYRSSLNGNLPETSSELFTLPAPEGTIV